MRKVVATSDEFRPGSLPRRAFSVGRLVSDVRRMAAFYCALPWRRTASFNLQPNHRQEKNMNPIYVSAALLGFVVVTQPACTKATPQAEACEALTKAGYAKDCHPVTEPPKNLALGGKCAVGMVSFHFVDSKVAGAEGLVCAAENLHAAEELAEYARGAQEAIHTYVRLTVGNCTVRADQYHPFLVPSGNLVVYFPQMAGFPEHPSTATPAKFINKVFPTAVSFIPYVELD